MSKKKKLILAELINLIFNSFRSSNNSFALKIGIWATIFTRENSRKQLFWPQILTNSAQKEYFENISARTSLFSMKSRKIGQMYKPIVQWAIQSIRLALCGNQRQHSNNLEWCYTRAPIWAISRQNVAIRRRCFTSSLWSGGMSRKCYI